VRRDVSVPRLRSHHILTIESAMRLTCTIVQRKKEHADDHYF
jgi:hypothetical protein